MTRTRDALPELGLRFRNLSAANERLIDIAEYSKAIHEWPLRATRDRGPTLNWTRRIGRSFHR